MNPRGHMTDQMSTNLARHGLGPGLGSGAYTHRGSVNIATVPCETPKETPRQNRVACTVPLRFPSKDKVVTLKKALGEGTARYFEEQQLEATDDTGSDAQFVTMVEGSERSRRVLEHAERGIHVIDSSFDREGDTFTFVWPSDMMRDALCSEETLIMFAHRPPYEPDVEPGLPPPPPPGPRIEALRASEPLPHAAVLVVDRDRYERGAFKYDALPASLSLPHTHSSAGGQSTVPLLARSVSEGGSASTQSKRLFLLVKDGATKGIGFARHVAKTFADAIPNVQRALMLDDDVTLLAGEAWNKIAASIAAQKTAEDRSGTRGSATASKMSTTEHAIPRPLRSTPAVPLTMNEGIAVLHDMMDHSRVKSGATVARPDHEEAVSGCMCSNPGKCTCRPVAVVAARCAYELSKNPLSLHLACLTVTGGGGCLLLNLSQCRNANFIGRAVRKELSEEQWTHLKILRDAARPYPEEWLDKLNKEGEKWEDCSLGVRIQMTLYQGEDFGFGESLAVGNGGYSTTVKHQNLIQKESGRPSVCGTIKARMLENFPGAYVAYRLILRELGWDSGADGTRET